MLSGPQGEESGTITVAAWDADHCKVAIALGPAVLRRSYTAVMNGNRAVVTAPAGMVGTAPLPIEPRLGCALLPAAIALDKLAGGGASLAPDPAGRPAALNWKVRGQPAALQYSDYSVSGGIGYAGTVTESLGGKTALTVHFDSIEPKSFTDADFALPPAPAGPAQPAGGVQ